MSDAATKRQFRTPESISAESATRARIKPFLESRGFQSVIDHRKSHGSSESQTIHAKGPTGDSMVIRVKLCWRLKPGEDQRAFSAAQLMAKTGGSEPQRSLEDFAARLMGNGVSHLLIAQPDGNAFREAALIPVGELVSIWLAQKDESDRCAQSTPTSKRGKNHALNGSSPTLYLRDDRKPSVSAVVWNHPGVIDLVYLSIVSPSRSEDTADDLIGFDDQLLGRDEAERIPMIISGVKRDPSVRRAVLDRCDRTCERPGCGNRREYSGFLDVHHIFGVEASDRTWTCVALCPNCHREAHFSPGRDHLNQVLSEYASRFKRTASDRAFTEGSDNREVSWLPPKK